MSRGGTVAPIAPAVSAPATQAAVQEAAATAKVHVIPGDPAKVIRQVAEEVHADLVILGRHLDKSFLGRLRTHSYAIVRESPCAVLSL